MTRGLILLLLLTLFPACGGMSVTDRLIIANEFSSQVFLTIVRVERLVYEARQPNGQPILSERQHEHIRDLLRDYGRVGLALNAALKASNEPLARTYLQEARGIIDALRKTLGPCPDPKPPELVCGWLPPDLPYTATILAGLDTLSSSLALVQLFTPADARWVPTADLTHGLAEVF